MKINSLILFVIIIFSFSCHKQKSDCGCDSSTISEATDLEGYLSYNPLTERLQIQGYPVGPTNNLYLICSKSGVDSSFFGNIDTNRLVIFSGAIKTHCPDNLHTSANNLLELILTKINYKQ